MSRLFAYWKFLFLVTYFKVKSYVTVRLKNLFKRRKTNVEEENIDLDYANELDSIPPETYRNIFLNASSTSYMYMSRRIFNKILISLPNNYVVPSGQIIQLLEKERKQKEEKEVDYQIFDQIRQSLPKSYSLIDPFVLQNRFSNIIPPEEIDEIKEESQLNQPFRGNNRTKNYKVI